MSDRRFQWWALTTVTGSDAWTGKYFSNNQSRALLTDNFVDVEDIGYYLESQIKGKKMLDTELAEFPEFEHALVQDLHEMIGKFRFD